MEEQVQQRLRLLHTLFGLTENTVGQWPGSLIWVQYVEKEAQRTWGCSLPSSLSALGYPPGFKILDALKFVTAVAGVLSESTEAATTIAEVSNIVIAKNGLDASSSMIRQAGYHAIFATIGWLTMLFKPSPSTCRDFQLKPERKQVGIKSSQSIDGARRPIARFLLGLGGLLPAAEQTIGLGGHKSSWNIHVSATNFYALSTVAKVNIEWVDTLSAHLQFDSLSRSLLLFRFPTFCALICVNEKSNTSDYRTLKQLYNPRTTESSALDLRSHSQEILLSYRILFGQHRRSRKLFSAFERRRVAIDDLYDPLLDRLCGQKYSKVSTLPSELWPDSCHKLGGNLFEQDVYSSDTDFPLLGRRLLDLQEFSRRQSPSKMKDLWRDRRNPLQWYTLWAVLLIGGISVVLQIIQIFLSAAQLAAQALIDEIFQYEAEGAVTLIGFYSHAGHSYDGDCEISALTLLIDEIEQLERAARWAPLAPQPAVEKA